MCGQVDRRVPLFHGGRDFLIGGTGANCTVGNADGDILVDGFSSHDFHENEFCVIMHKGTRPCSLMTRPTSSLAVPAWTGLSLKIRKTRSPPLHHEVFISDPQFING